MSDESNKIEQDDVDGLLRQAQAAGSGATDGPAAVPPSPTPAADPSNAAGTAVADAPAASAGTTLPGEDMDVLFRQATEALNSIDQPSDNLPAGLEPFELRDLAGTPASTDQATLDLLRDVELDLKIELGRTQLCLEDVLQLRKGSVVPLDKLAGDPVDIYVNGRLVARGEVLVLNDNFCVRVGELVAGDAVA